MNTLRPISASRLRTGLGPGIGQACRNSGSRAALLLFAGIFFSACAGPQPAPKNQNEKGAPSRLDLLLPLKDATISQFATTADGAMPGTFVLEISRPRPELAELRIAGRVQRLLIDAGRIRHATGGTLLEEPLERGHSYRGSFGTVTITKVDETITVPAGRFEHCLETVEESEQAAKRATSTFCPHVGLVSLRVEAFSGDVGLVENLLTQHGPRYE